MGFNYDDIEQELERLDKLPLSGEEFNDDYIDEYSNDEFPSDEFDYNENQFSEIGSSEFDDIKIPESNKEEKPDFINIDFGSSSSESLVENVEPIVKTTVEEYHSIENPNNLPDDSLIEDISGRFSDVDYNVEPETEYPYLKIFGITLVEERDILQKICEKYRNEEDYIDFRVDFKNKKIGVVSMNLNTLLTIRELGMYYTDKLDEDGNPIYNEYGNKEKVVKQRYGLKLFYSEEEYDEIDLMNSDSLINSIEIH